MSINNKEDVGLIQLKELFRDYKTCNTAEMNMPLSDLIKKHTSVEILYNHNNRLQHYTISDFDTFKMKFDNINKEKKI